MPIIYICDDCGETIKPQNLAMPLITSRIGGQIVRCFDCQVARDAKEKGKIFPDLELPKVIED